MEGSQWLSPRVAHVLRNEQGPGTERGGPGCSAPRGAAPPLSVGRWFQQVGGRWQETASKAEVSAGFNMWWAFLRRALSF